MGSTLFQKLDNQVLIQLRKGFFHKSGFPESPRPPNRTGAEYLCSGLTDKKYALCQSLSPSAGDGFPLKQNSQVFACQESELESVRNQPVTASSFIVGMPWKSHDIDIPTVDWKSGYYAFNFVEQSGRRYDDIAFIVVTNPLRKGDILVKLSTNTYQAYNKWGGGSLYSTILRGVPHADTVSFDRPTVSQFYRWEYYYVLWLEELANQLISPWITRRILTFTASQRSRTSTKSSFPWVMMNIGPRKNLKVTMIGYSHWGRTHCSWAWIRPISGSDMAIFMVRNPGLTEDDNSYVLRTAWPTKHASWVACTIL